VKARAGYGIGAINEKCALLAAFRRGELS